MNSTYDDLKAALIRHNLLVNGSVLQSTHLLADSIDMHLTKRVDWWAQMTGTTYASLVNVLPYCCLLANFIQLSADIRRARITDGNVVRMLSAYPVYLLWVQAPIDWFAHVNLDTVAALFMYESAEDFVEKCNFYADRSQLVPQHRKMYDAHVSFLSDAYLPTHEFVAAMFKLGSMQYLFTEDRHGR